MSELNVNAITDASGGNTASINGATPTNDNLMGRNRIINGAMEIDQRNDGAAVNLNASGIHFIDRYSSRNNGGTWGPGVLSAQRSSTAPAGFKNSLALTVSTADSSITSDDTYLVSQLIEGYNISDFGYGTADAKTVTVSFWVRSSLTGTFAGSLTNNFNTRAYPFNYAILSADTWEYKTITILGDTTGTWSTDNSIGIRLNFDMGTGSNRQGTLNTWQATGACSTPSAVQLIGTLNATWYMTGLQLEAGSVATSFERVDYGEMLRRCQRYYYRIKADAGGQVLGSGMMQTATAGRFFIPFMVPMRTSPSALEQSGTASNYVVFNGGSAQNCNAVPTFNSATLYGAGLQATIASGGTIGYGALIRADSSAAYLGWTAEL